MTMADLREITHAPARIPSPLQRYRADPGRHVVAQPGLVLTATGDAGLDGNYIVVFEPHAPDNVLETARAFFHEQAFAVLVEVESAPEMEAALRSRGWQLDEEEPALVLTDPSEDVPPAPDGLEIRLVTTSADFESFCAFAQPDTRWVPSLEAALDRHVAIFLGFVDGTLAATSRLGIYGDVGEINSVITAAEFRRCGFGTALTWAAIAEAARRGCSAVSLTASEMGLPVYLRMGFELVCTYRTYIPPGSA